MSSPAPTQQRDPSTAAEDRSARMAVTLFPILILAAAAFGYLAPSSAKPLLPHVNTLLGIIMFGMGLSLRGQDFALVARRPLPVLIGVVAQYLVMPLLGWAVAKALGLSPELAAGVILVGCAPGGTASADFRKMIDADIQNYVAVVKAANLKFE